MGFDPVVFSALVKKYKDIVGTFKTEHIRKKNLDSVPCNGDVIDLKKYPILKNKLKNHNGPGFVIRLTDHVGAPRIPLTGLVAIANLPLSTGEYICAVDNTIFAINPDIIRTNVNAYGGSGTSANFRVLKRTAYITNKIETIEHIGQDKCLIRFANSTMAAILDVKTGAYVEKDVGAGFAWNRSGIASYVIGNKIVICFGINNPTTDFVKTYDFNFSSEAAVTTGLPANFNIAGVNNQGGVFQLILSNKANNRFEVYESNAAVTSFTKIAELPSSVGLIAASSYDWLNINKSTLFISFHGSIIEFNFATKEFKILVNNSRRKSPSTINGTSYKFTGILSNKIIIGNYPWTAMVTPEYNSEMNRKCDISSINFTINGNKIKFDSIKTSHNEPYSINFMVQAENGTIIRGMQNGMVGVNNPRFYKTPKIGSNNSSYEVRLITGPAQS